MTRNQAVELGATVITMGDVLDTKLLELGFHAALFVGDLQRGC